MPDPVSWLLIRDGWRLLDAAGGEVGVVAEVVGDENVDIFDGLAVEPSLAGKVRYVPAESVGEILEGEVHLTISGVAVDALPEYEEPPTSAQILPDNASLLERVEGDTVDRTRRVPERVPFLRRLRVQLDRLLRPRG